jgi:hypothetical protein
MKEKVKLVTSQILIKDFGKQFVILPIPKENAVISIQRDHIDITYPDVVLSVYRNKTKLQTSNGIIFFIGQDRGYLDLFYSL